ncbi:hypothetical protein OUZ56_018644 [Daphnia magna]|uniref:MULE transposase domain-containing protein n=1 Tax=Daphnia magna TaxID=35525 RepID=A0ABQ9Z9C8_9CRUS|nr:hypothetical protein OUZ56_018644 [Daphnia magna]
MQGAAAIEWNHSPTVSPQRGEGIVNLRPTYDTVEVPIHKTPDRPLRELKYSFHDKYLRGNQKELSDFIFIPHSEENPHNHSPNIETAEVIDVRNEDKKAGLLWSIHGTILGEGGESKSVPLLHVAMTRRKEADYVAVLEFIKSKLHTPAIKQFTSDYKKELWKAVERVFPRVQHRGCSYNQIQEKMRRLKDKEHFATEYRTDPEIRRIVQLTLCLCYLHHSEIRPSKKGLGKTHTGKLRNGRLQPKEEEKQRAGGYAQPMKNPRRGTQNEDPNGQRQLSDSRLSVSDEGSELHPSEFPTLPPLDQGLTEPATAHCPRTALCFDDHHRFGLRLALAVAWAYAVLHSPPLHMSMVMVSMIDGILNFRQHCLKEIVLYTITPVYFIQQPLYGLYHSFPESAPPRV